MYLELFLAFLTAGASAGIFAWVFSTEIRARLYALECDLADLQERHLKMVRKNSVNSRWDNEALVEERISALAPTSEPVKKKGWTKWPSRSENSSPESSVAE